MNKIVAQKGFTKFYNDYFDSLLCLAVKGRELRVMLLILRLTTGCLDQTWARILQADLQIVGINASSAANILKNLLEKKWIIRNEKTQEYRINTEYLASEKILAQLKTRVQRLEKAVGIQLKKVHSQNTNSNDTEEITLSLPNNEAEDYRNDNGASLLKTKLSQSDVEDFSSAKDILKIFKNTDKYQIGIKKHQGNINEFNKVDPLLFSAQTESQDAALKAWTKLEPNNPGSFPFYLAMVKKGLPAEKFYQFTSDILNDSKISPSARGKVFNHKVAQYFEGQR